MPTSACCVRPVRPCPARSAHAFLSPIFGAPLVPGPWQPAHTASTTSLPLRLPLWALAPCAAIDNPTVVTPINSNFFVDPIRHECNVTHAFAFKGYLLRNQPTHKMICKTQHPLRHRA